MKNSTKPELCKVCGEVADSGLWICHKYFAKLKKFLGNQFEENSNIFCKHREEYLEEYLKQNKKEVVLFD